MISKSMLTKAGSFIWLFMVVAHIGFSQGKTVTGTVTDSKDGSPVPNVSVTIKGTKLGTTTDANGLFRLAVDNNAVLVISSVGFNRQEVAVGALSDLSVSLVAAQNNLNEVVVVGYGTQRKRDLTGAVATVSSKDFVKGAIQTPEQLIAGKVAGVQITSNNGAAGSGSRIRIRGGSSLTNSGTSNDPLVVIDGLPVDNGNALSLINPNDIESFTLLKDPSAAAIYGSRASNGVIIITTKKGKKGKLRFNFNAQGFAQTPIKNADILTADEFRNLISTSTDQNILSSLPKLGKSNTNWQDEIYRTAIGQDYNLSISGAVIDGKVPFRLSGGYLNQDGMLKTDNFQRLSGAINISPRFFKERLKVDFNLKMARTQNADANFGAVGAAVAFDPTQTTRTNSNRYGGYFEWLNSVGRPAGNSTINPLSLLYMRDHQRELFRTLGNVQFDYTVPFIKGLRVNLNLGQEFQNERGTFNGTDSAAANYPAIGGKGGYRNTSYLERRNRLLDVYLNYVKDIKSINSRIDFTAGHGTQEYFYYNFNSQERNYDGSPNLSRPLSPFLANNSDAVNGDNGYMLISYYSRLNYTLAGRYVFTFNGRADGSSRFSKENRWGFFPSAAFAWRVSEEKFLKNSKTISDLKVRVGYGITGQQDIRGLYPYLAVYNQSNNNGLYQFGNTFYNRLGPVEYDPNIKWETTRNINLALEYGLFDNRVTGILEVFSRKTEDLVSEVPIPLGANFANNLLTNVGNIESEGFEVTMNFVPVRNKNLQWDIGFNFTYANPKITKLLLNDDPNFVGNRYDVVGISTPTRIDAVGNRPGSFYMYQQVYDKSNNPIEGLYEDLNRDGLINEKDLRVFKPAEAPAFLGINSSLTYKKFNAGFVMRGSIGNYIYNQVAMENGVLNQLKIGTNPANIHRSYLETGFVTKQELSDYYIQNGSFLRLDNINFGYEVGQIAKNATLRISANIQNVFIITKYTGIDPEINGGRDNNIYPRPRTYVLGVNLDF